MKAIAKLESEIGIAQQLAQAIVDDATQKFLELILGKLGEVHTDGGYGVLPLKCNWQNAETCASAFCSFGLFGLSALFG